MNPLRIKCKLGNSFVTNDSEMPLDGILMLEQLKLEYGNNLQEVLPDPKEQLIYPSEIPLRIKNRNLKRWYYSCSFAFYENLAESTQYWHKRLDSKFSNRIDWKKKVEKVDIGSGIYRGYRMPMNTIHTNEIIWYAFGDKKRIESLLSNVFFIGKKRSYGNGKVLEWIVEKIENDYSEVKEGRVTRAIPINNQNFEFLLDKGFSITYRSYRPPYWHKDNMSWCLYNGK